VNELCHLQKESEITSQEYLLDRIALFEGKVEALSALKPTLYEAIAQIEDNDTAPSCTSVESESEQYSKEQLTQNSQTQVNDSAEQPDVAENEEMLSAKEVVEHKEEADGPNT